MKYESEDDKVLAQESERCEVIGGGGGYTFLKWQSIGVGAEVGEWITNIIILQPFHLKIFKIIQIKITQTNVLFILFSVEECTRPILNGGAVTANSI